MFLTVLPVSGGNFATQLSIIIHLCEIEFKPNFIFSSSGGNVSAYISTASNWDRSNIYKLCNLLNCDMFLNKWCYSKNLSYLIGIFLGSLYNSGQGLEENFIKWFSLNNKVEKINNEFYCKKDIEIWTGTYNWQHQKPRIFTNISKGESKIINENVNENHCLPIYYSNHNLNIMCSSMIASASVPSLVPGKYISGELYVDGGVFSASPLSVLYNQIKIDNYHLIYISPVDTSKTENLNIKNLIDNVRFSTDFMVKSNVINDKNICYNLLKTRFNTIQDYTFDCNFENLLKIKNIWNLCDNTMSDFYPKNKKTLNLENFNNKDIINVIEEQYSNLSCKFSIPKQELTDEIENLLFQCMNNKNSNKDIVIL